MKPTRTIAIPSFTHRIGYQAGLLGGMATIISLLLIMGDQSTREDIQLRLEEDTRIMLDQVLPADLYDNNPLELRYSLKDSPFPGHNVAYLATRNGQLSGLAMEVVGKGYSGDIVLLLGLNEKGEITGVRTISHAETPGLGDKIEIKKNDWVTSFNGYSLENHSATQWQVKKDGGDFDQFTGATITPRAVVKAVKTGLIHYSQQRATIEGQLSAAMSANKEASK
ncbi:electron transport complex subunit RsxG [Amphritea pacifica]|uniref:Ion-translocating oxidoreductase complex subunit G n=1 Tax=Amphritea pacifica TaxID=2811233 RepID=A0ABS2WDD3_9GAMM|nr:electron transport complex subunit RsxG [Amphritea pacifica]MBN0989717.1 electron transport complex subunit RsxG [Amphritea pacifica]MBN1007386.1 electron transport complex subunit RsxG [Amphritea pacifica]